MEYDFRMAYSPSSGQQRDTTSDQGIFRDAAFVMVLWRIIFRVARLYLPDSVWQFLEGKVYGEYSFPRSVLVDGWGYSQGFGERGYCFEASYVGLYSCEDVFGVFV